MKLPFDRNIRIDRKSEVYGMGNKDMQKHEKKKKKSEKKVIMAPPPLPFIHKPK